LWEELSPSPQAAWLVVAWLPQGVRLQGFPTHRRCTHAQYLSAAGICTRNMACNRAEAVPTTPASTAPAPAPEQSTPLVVCEQQLMPHHHLLPWYCSWCLSVDHTTLYMWGQQVGDAHHANTMRKLVRGLVLVVVVVLVVRGVMMGMPFRLAEICTAPRCSPIVHDAALYDAALVASASAFCHCQPKLDGELAALVCACAYGSPSVGHVRVGWRFRTPVGLGFGRFWLRLLRPGSALFANLQSQLLVCFLLRRPASWRLLQCSLLPLAASNLRRV
jgi:hypothetical protein